MNAIEGLIYGFGVALGPGNILAVLGGALIGSLIGVLPGIGPVATMALLLPTTFVMSPDTAIIMLAGIYYGAMYGGSTTSILVKVPGEAASIITAIDGYEMSKKGRAGAALAVSAIGSFVAGTMGIIALMLFAPPLATFALAFGPPEFFALALFGLFVLSGISGRSLWQNLLVLSLGLALATIGMDPVSGTSRFTGDWIKLSQGIDLVPAVMGLFGVGEMLYIAEQRWGLPQIATVKLRELFPNLLEWKRSWAPMIRGGVVGFFWGLIPGPAPLLASFTSYKMEKRLSKYKDEFGHGAIEGVAGPESANNAASEGALVPVLSLGLPFSPATAMLISALMIHGVQPGPLLIAERPDIFWGVVASLYLGNVALLVLNLPLLGVWVSLLRIPQSVLMASVLLLCLVGAYSLNNSLLDVAVLIAMGGVGYFFNKLRLDPAPIAVAMVLGPILESALRQSMRISGGDPFIFIQRPISAIFIGSLLFLALAKPVYHYATKSRRQPETQPIDH
jgi:putative tricarboxylic transport membrane protein